jgi:hypothetical protein
VNLRANSQVLSGMLFSIISTRCIADLISTGKSPVSLVAFDPACFTPTLHASL